MIHGKILYIFSKKCKTMNNTYIIGVLVAIDVTSVIRSYRVDAYVSNIPQLY